MWLRGLQVATIQNCTRTCENLNLWCFASGRSAQQARVKTFLSTTQALPEPWGSLMGWGATKGAQGSGLRDDSGIHPDPGAAGALECMWGGGQGSPSHPDPDPG